MSIYVFSQLLLIFFFEKIYIFACFSFLKYHSWIEIVISVLMYKIVLDTILLIKKDIILTHYFYSIGMIRVVLRFYKMKFSLMPAVTELLHYPIRVPQRGWHAQTYVDEAYDIYEIIRSGGSVLWSEIVKRRMSFSVKEACFY